ncbi:MAG TPA: alpha/beta hydrolase [Streptosporangiaceae bacterium]
MKRDGSIEGFEALPLALTRDGGGGAAVLRRRSARPGRRAVVYVHCPGDAFVDDELVVWFTHRGFHFYAADLREVGAEAGPGQDGNRVVADLSECFSCLDAAAAHVRQADAIETVVICAHGTGALVSALWCHARRASGSTDALVLATPHLSRGSSWRARLGAAREDGGPAGRRAAMRAAAQRRLRRGLDIACPVLVMCPAREWDSAGVATGPLVLRALFSAPATVRLGEHVTWLKLDGGQPFPDAPERKRFFDELGRWLGAYLSGQVRDQLL